MNARLEEINGWLRAYRAGWVSYDADHVKALQSERLEIIAALGE